MTLAFAPNEKQCDLLENSKYTLDIPFADGTADDSTLL
jgi:hypothetical protein